MLSENLKQPNIRKRNSEEKGWRKDWHTQHTGTRKDGWKIGKLGLEKRREGRDESNWDPEETYYYYY